MIHPRRFVRTPRVLQLHTFDCGIAALLSILKYFGQDLERADLESQMRPTRNGTSLETIVNVANSLNVPAYARRCTATDVLASKAPTLLHWCQTHYIIYEGSHHGKVRINDPASGRKTIRVEEFSRRFSGSAVLFDQTPDMGKVSGTLRTVKEIMSGLWVPISEEPLQLLVGFFTGLACGSLFLFIQNSFSAHDASMVGVISMLLAIAFAMLVSTLLLEQWRVGMRERHLRNLAASALKSDFLTLRHWSSQFVLLLANPNLLALPNETQALKLIAALIALVGLVIVVPEHHLGAYAVFVVAFTIVAGALLVTKSLKKTEKEKEPSDQVGSTADAWFVDMVSDITFLQRLRRTPSLRDVIMDSVHARLRQNERGHLIDLFMVLAHSITAVGMSAFAVLAPLDTGSVIALLVAATGLMGSALANLGQEASPISNPMRRAVVRELENGIMHKGSPKPNSTTGGVDTERCQLRFEHVYFGFSGARDRLLRDINLSIDKGRVVLVLGNHGIGKSVLGQVAAGLLSPDRGAIFIGDQPLISPANCSNPIYVTGDKPFRAGTITSNLQPFHQQDSVDETWILDNTSLIQTIGDLNNGVSTLIQDDGFPLSEGESDRLRLAHVLSVKPCFAIFDETFRHFTAAEEVRAISALRQRQIGALVLTSHTDALSSYDHVCHLENGQLRSFIGPLIGNQSKNLISRDT